jgi:hypothetical protein
MRLAAFVLSIVVMGAIVYCAYCYRIELGLVNGDGSEPASTAGSGTHQGQTGDSSIPAPSAPASTGARTTDWRTVALPSGGFTVEMPGEVTDGHAPAFTRRGTEIEIPLVESSPRAGNWFAVAWDNNPPIVRATGEAAEKTLDMAQEGALTRTRAVLTAQWQSNASGYPERDFTGSIGEGGVLNARLILAGKRLFLLIATFPSSSAAQDKEVDRFFNSFRLAESAQRF